MLMNQAEYDKHLKGFEITGCAIRSKDIFYFVALSDYDLKDSLPEDSERTFRVIPFFLKEELRWSYVSYDGYEGLMAGASQQPESKFIGVDRSRYAVVLGGGSNEVEEIPCSINGPLRSRARRVKTINGYVHACSAYRGLARRDGAHLWVSLCANLEMNLDRDPTSAPYGFNDFDAFGDGEFYCVGGRSDVWRLDGQGWTFVEFPNDSSQLPYWLKNLEDYEGVKLESVCCAGDGYVYIGGPSGAVWKGRHDQWKLIHDVNLTLPFKDMVWFQDRVYCTSDYGFWEIVNGKVRPCDVPEEIRICSGNLSVADGVMLLAGEGGAAYHDGHKWKLIFNTSRFT